MLIEAFIQDADIPGTSVAYWIHNPSKVTDVITKGIPIVNVSVTIFPSVHQVDSGDWW